MPVTHMLFSKISAVPVLLAQSGVSKSWLEILSDMEIPKLVIILMIGTGLVSAGGYAVANIIRALNATPEDAEEMSTRIKALEQRVATLESEQSELVRN